MRLDRWFKVHFPGLGFGPLQKLLRSGQIRVDGARAKSDTRVQPGQTIRVPPLGVDAKDVKSGPIAGRDLRHSSDGELLSRMPAYRPPRIAASEITPEPFFLDRRRFLAAAGGLVLGGAGLADAAELKASGSRYKVEETLTPEKDVTTYNNFYEFGTGKGDPAANSGGFKPAPWRVKVDGLVGKPKEFGLEELLAFPLEERTYRMRCVEAWSMVIPWVGFPLAGLLDMLKRPRIPPDWPWKAWANALGSRPGSGI